MYPSDHSVSVRTQEARETTIATHTETTIVTGQGDRNRPLVMKCDCPDGCLSPCGASLLLCTEHLAGLLSISTGRQTEALGGSGAAPCAVTGDCYGYGTPAEVITPDQSDQAVAGALRARPEVRGRASAV